jgi:hypothetical protein
MVYAQFVAIPPLAIVAEIFVFYTGCRLELGAHWISFNKGIAPGLAVIHPFIRPSHNRLLSACESGECPLAFLRQILRPFGFSIKKQTHGFRVENDTSSPVKIRAGSEINWD